MELGTIVKYIFEITVMWVIFYQMYRLFHRERAAMIMGGLVILGVIVFALVRIIDATELEVVGGALVPVSTILAILFQSEIRTALARIGRGSLSKLLHHNATTSDFIENLCSAVNKLSSKCFGALIVICREDKLSAQVASADTVLLDAVFSKELVESIFYVNKQGQGNPLHDGAVVIDNERVLAARVQLPVSDRELKDRALGLRHRAGIGIAEASDAVAIIVSEETGGISLAVGGGQGSNVGPELQRNLSGDLLKKRLKDLLNYHEQQETADAPGDSVNDEAQGSADE